MPYGRGAPGSNGIFSQLLLYRSDRKITLPALSVFNREVKFIFPGIDVVVFDELKNAFSRAVKTETAVFRRISQPFQGVRSFDLSGVLSRFKPKLPILLTSPSVFQGHDVVTPAETWTPPQPVQVVVVLGVTLGANPLSLRVRTQLDRATDAYARSLERLSSGMRINRASDDAAGLAIADALKAGAERPVLQPAGRGERGVGRHHGGQLDDASGQRLAVGNNYDSYHTVPLP